MSAHAIVVDDDPASATATAKLLSSLGCAARVCTRPEDAVALALDEAVELVTLDLGMPLLDGYAVLSLIRSHEHTERAPAVPVIAITGRTDAAHRAEALAAGFAAYVTKPVGRPALRQALAVARTMREVLGRNRYPAELPQLGALLQGIDPTDRERRVATVVGLALTVEQQGRATLAEALGFALAADREAAARALQPLIGLVGVLRAEALSARLRELQLVLAVGGDGELHAALARAELDRLVYALREHVLG